MSIIFLLKFRLQNDMANNDLFYKSSLLKNLMFYGLSNSLLITETIARRV